ncbi:MAG TPA: metallopeptidase TldD-related protein [Nocardioidaceae bacterium]|nr:metallopeptidase TldD-related protein [Nocardioidaceae bacterium]
MTTPAELIDVALSATTADSAVVVARASSTTNLRWANNTLTTNGVMSSTHLTMISIVDGAAGAAAGVVTRSTTSASQVRDLVRAADAAASEASPAADAAELVSGESAIDFEEPPGVSSIDSLATFATSLGDAFQESRGRDRLLYGYAEQDVTTTYVASSTGLRLRHEQPTAHVGITAKPTDLTASAWVGQAAESISDFHVDALTEELSRRLGWSARRVELPAGRYETILPPAAVADLIIYSYFRSSGRDAAEGQTVFSNTAGGTRVGERITAPTVGLRSDPHQPGMRALPFVAATSSSSVSSVFDNGLPIAATEWISEGTLRALGTSRYTATLTGLPEKPLVDNLALAVNGATGSVDDLVASTDRGLLLTCLWYIREVDPHTLLLTGLTRDGVYLVEDGEVVGAVNNFRFNESPIDLLGRFTESGEAVRSFSREWGDYFPRTVTPSLRIPDFNMSSVSQAS